VSAEAGPEVIDGIVRTAHHEGAWGDVLPLLAVTDDHHLPRAVNLPTTADPEVLRAVVEAADAAHLWDDLLPVVVHLDDVHLAALAAMGETLPADVVQRMVLAVLPRRPMWGALATTLSRVPEAEQRALAARLVAADEADVPLVVDVLGSVPEAADLPLLAALRAHAEE